MEEQSNSIPCESSVEDGIDWKETSRHFHEEKIYVKTENVFVFWEVVIDELVRTGKIGNSKAYINTFSIFKKFRKEKDLTFNELNYNMVKKFDTYMLEQGLQVNGISFHMRTLRALYNRAVKDGGASKNNYPFEKYKIKREKTVHRALT